MTFERTYGGTQFDDAYSVLQLPDHGYILGGHTNSFGTGSYDFWLVRTDSFGDTLWTRTYGGASTEHCYSVQQTADGGYVMAGCTESFGAGGRDAWLVKTNDEGDTEWTRTYGDTLWESVSSVQQTSEGGFILTGSTESFGAGNADLWLLRTDSLGETLWTRTYGDTSWDRGRAVVQTADCGYILVGSTQSFGAGLCDIWLVKTNPLGDTEWTRTFGGADQEDARSVLQTSDGGYVLVGFTESFSADGYDVWLIKTDSGGDTAWTRTYSYADIDWGYSVQQTIDGGYVIAGKTTVGRFDEAYLITTDNRGETLWTRTYGHPFSDAVYSVLQTSDGGYVLAGSTNSIGAGAVDAWLVKTDSLGRVGIEEPQPSSPPRPSPTATICRGVLLLPALGHGPTGRRGTVPVFLLDASGRKVMPLLPGANDVHHLSPGVYFVRQEGRGDEGFEGTSAKVVIQR